MSEADRSYYQRNRAAFLAKCKERREGPLREEILRKKREYYARNKEQILEKQRDSYQQNKPARLEGCKKYREENVEKVRARKAKYCAENKEKVAAKKRSDYLANREQILAARKGSESVATYMREYRQKNKEKLDAQNKSWRARNPDKYKAMRQTWRDEHKAERVHAEGRRRVKKKQNGGTHTFNEWIDKCEQHGWACVYCGAEGEMTRDHDIPVSRGGPDSIDNIVPACRSCNSAKGTMTGDEYRARQLRKAA